MQEIVNITQLTSKQLKKLKAKDLDNKWHQKYPNGMYAFIPSGDKGYFSHISKRPTGASISGIGYGFNNRLTLKEIKLRTKEGLREVRTINSCNRRIVSYPCLRIFGTNAKVATKSDNWLDISRKMNRNGASNEFISECKEIFIKFRDKEPI